MVFAADETADVGIDLAIPAVEAIGTESQSRGNGRGELTVRKQV
jgi:arylsulfatase